MGANRYHVTSLALWGEYRQQTHPVHKGSLDFTAELDGDTLEHFEPEWPYRVVLQFANGMLHVTEEGSGMYGLNVTFEGTYRKRGDG